jgi:hypothetical protein
MVVVVLSMLLLVLVVVVVLSMLLLSVVLGVVVRRLLVPIRMVKRGLRVHPVHPVVVVKLLRRHVVVRRLARRLVRRLAVLVLYASCRLELESLGDDRLGRLLLEVQWLSAGGVAIVAVAEHDGRRRLLLLHGRLTRIEHQSSDVTPLVRLGDHGGVVGAQGGVVVD